MRQQRMWLSIYWYTDKLNQSIIDEQGQYKIIS